MHPSHCSHHHHHSPPQHYCAHVANRRAPRLNCVPTRALRCHSCPTTPCLLRLLRWPHRLPPGLRRLLRLPSCPGHLRRLPARFRHLPLLPFLLRLRLLLPFSSLAPHPPPRAPPPTAHLTSSHPPQSTFPRSFRLSQSSLTLVLSRGDSRHPLLLPLLPALRHLLLRSWPPPHLSAAGCRAEQLITKLPLLLHEKRHMQGRARRAQTEADIHAFIASMRVSATHPQQWRVQSQLPRLHPSRLHHSLPAPHRRQPRLLSSSSTSCHCRPPHPHTRPLCSAPRT